MQEHWKDVRVRGIGIGKNRQQINQMENHFYVGLQSSRMGRSRGIDNAGRG